jgi:hypothetical protein
MLPTSGLLPPAGFCPLQDLHARLQPLLIFFIDAANYIDDGAGSIDPRWELYLATELTAAGRIIVSAALRCSEHHTVPRALSSRLKQVKVLGRVI